MYFSHQPLDDTFCVIHALNNLFGGPVVSYESIFQYKIRKIKTDGEYPACSRGNSGLWCQNEIVDKILRKIQWKVRHCMDIAARHPKIQNQNSWKFIEAVNWGDVKKDYGSLEDYLAQSKGDVIGVYGNLKGGPVDHAVCVIVTKYKTMMVNSLKEGPTEMRTRHYKKFQPFVVLRKKLVLDVDHSRSRSPKSSRGSHDRRNKASERV